MWGVFSLFWDLYPGLEILSLLSPLATSACFQSHSQAASSLSVWALSMDLLLAPVVTGLKCLLQAQWPPRN